MHTNRLISLPTVLTCLSLSTGCTLSTDTEVENAHASAEALSILGSGAPLKASADSSGASKSLNASTASAVSIQGKLTRLEIGRAQSTGLNGGIRYFVMGSDHTLQEVEISATVAAQAGGFDAIVGRSVTVSGSSYSSRGGLVATQVAASLSAAFAPASLATQSFVGSKRWAMIPCRFSEMSNPAPHSRAYFDALMGNSAPGLGHYWSTASNGRLSMQTTTFDWLPMPKPASYYNLQTPNEKLDELVSDCLTQVFITAPDFNLLDYAGFSLAFSHNLENQVVAGTLSSPESTQGFSVLSPVEFNHQASVARAMGAGFDFTYSGTAALKFDSPWDAMSQGFALSSTGLSCRSLTSSFGCGAVLPAAEHGALVGWLDSGQIATVPRNTQLTVDLDFVGASPLPGHHGLIRVPIDATHYLTVEARKQNASSYDVGVPRTSLLIQRMDTSPIPDEETPQQILEAATRLRLVDAPAQGVTSWSNGAANVVLTFAEQSAGYRVTVDRVPPPPPEPEPEPEPDPEPDDCWSRCHAPLYKCEQICGEF